MEWKEFKRKVEEGLYSYHPHLQPSDLPEDRSTKKRFDDDYLEAWTNAGSPHVWSKEISRPDLNVECWGDRGHGWIALVVNSNVSVGKDIVYNNDFKFLVIGEYYGVEKLKLFKAV